MINPIRLPAEWEPQRAVQLTFPHQGTDWSDMMEAVLPCFVEIAMNISRFQRVLIVCTDEAATRALFPSVENLVFATCPSNDTWARDHGAITVLENGKPKLLDFVFNGWGLKFPADKDNLITRRLHSKGIFGKTPIQHGGMVLEGGGIESNGKGCLMTTTSCMLSPNRNPHMSQQQTEDKLRQLFGVSQILWLQHGYLAGDDTDSHIDTLARFCDEATIAYASCQDIHDEHYAELKLMEAELQSFRQANGQPFRLVPLPMPDACLADDGHRLPATYANFLVINGAVLVPVYGVAQDEEALAVFNHLFPNREIIGINCRSLIEQHGSLHCVTMQFIEPIPI
ncbi:MAG TPA: agmatine deiminase family protein [Saprospiraceae bacterium]|nr:agmatine deiminase family protein [Saprospiraceae bacterium]HMQ85716.1 agmatine deiminase family protein [Saprospiraceae bacterium]